MKWIGRKTQHQNTMSCVFLWLHKITRFLEVIYDQSSSIWPDPEVRIRSSKVRLQRLLVKARRRAWTSLLSMIQLQFSVCGMIDSSTHIYTHTYKHKHTHIDVWCHRLLQSLKKKDALKIFQADGVEDAIQDMCLPSAWLHKRLANLALALPCLSRRFSICVQSS